jgi:hypothetical protein
VDNVVPILPKPNTLHDEPMRDIDLMLKALPSDIKSRTLVDEPKEHVPKVDTNEPNLVMPRIDKDDPKLTCINTETVASLGRCRLVNKLYTDPNLPY